jgi:TRAP-type C4-dicarboxylate transport system permease small subunit
MKRWPWRTILTAFACILIVVGLAPVIYLSWFVYAANWTPMTMALPLHRGTYTSPSFKTGLHDQDKPYYLAVVAGRILDGQGPSCIEAGKVIESYACRGDGRILDMDWKFVDGQGKVLKQGTYNGRIYGGLALDEKVTDYLPPKNTPLKVVLDIHQDIQGFDGAHPRLELQANPEYGLESAYGSAAFLGWAVIVAGPGAIILVVLLFMRLFWQRAHRKSPDIA